jgi:hypothetical protein
VRCYLRITAELFVEALKDRNQQPRAFTIAAHALPLDATFVDG